MQAIMLVTILQNCLPFVLLGRRMNKRTKLILLVGLLAAYVAGYAVCRTRGELIHRLTWSDGDRAHHWITPGSYENRIQFIVLPSEEDMRYARRIQIRRSIFQVVYFPLVVVESVSRWMIEPRI